MAGKLDKKQITERAKHISAIEEAYDAFEKAIEKYNGEMSTVWLQTVEPALIKLNSKIEAADTFRDQIHSDLETFYDEKSDKWQDGEKGSAFASFRDEWSNELSQIDLEMPDEIQAPDLDVVDMLENLPDQPEEV